MTTQSISYWFRVSRRFIYYKMDGEGSLHLSKRNVIMNEKYYFHAVRVPSTDNNHIVIPYDGLICSMMMVAVVVIYIARFFGDAADCTWHCREFTNPFAYYYYYYCWQRYFIFFFTRPILPKTRTLRAPQYLFDVIWNLLVAKLVVWVIVRIF